MALCNFCSLLKIYKCLFIPNCTRKIILLPVIYKWQFLWCFSILCDKWRQQATSTLLDKNLTCEFKHKNSFTLPNHVWKLSSFFKLWNAVFTHSWIEELDHKAKERLPSLQFCCGFLTKCVLSGWETVGCVYAKKKLFNPAQVALTKISRNEGKI